MKELSPLNDSDFLRGLHIENAVALGEGELMTCRQDVSRPEPLQDTIGYF